MKTKEDKITTLKEYIRRLKIDYPEDYKMCLTIEQYTESHSSELRKENEAMVVAIGTKNKAYNVLREENKALRSELDALRAERKVEAVGFAEWLHENNYMPHKAKGRWSGEPFCEPLTTAELYDKYLQSLKNK